MTGSSERPWTYEPLAPAPGTPLTRTSTRSFFGAPLHEDLDTLTARVAVLGIPYDYGTLVPQSRTGSSRAPDAIRDARGMAYYDPITGEEAPGRYDVEDDKVYLQGVTIADVGNVSIGAGAAEMNLDRMTEAARKIGARDSLLVAVGGDHSISFPVVRGLDRYDELDVVHFDAYDGFEDHANGSRYSHRSHLRRISELPFVRNITMVAARCGRKQPYDDARAQGVRVIPAAQLLSDGPSAAIEETVPAASNIYVSIGLNALDHSLMPGTTTPEPEGLNFQQLREALWAVCRKGKIVGFDLVELSPPHDFANAGAGVAARLAAHFLGGIF